MRVKTRASGMLAEGGGMLRVLLRGGGAAQKGLAATAAGRPVAVTH